MNHWHFAFSISLLTTLLSATPQVTINGVDIKDILMPGRPLIIDRTKLIPAKLSNSHMVLKADNGTISIELVPLPKNTAHRIRQYYISLLFSQQDRIAAYEFTLDTQERYERMLI